MMQGEALKAVMRVAIPYSSGKLLPQKLEAQQASEQASVAIPYSSGKLLPRDTSTRRL